MKYFELCLVSIILVKCSFGVPSTAEPSHFVMGGTPATPGEFPSAVFIEIPDRVVSHCGGTILNDEHVVTAAHCLIRYSFGGPTIIHSQLLRVIAGDLFVIPASFGRIVRHVSNVFIHPGFNHYSLENDIAVLRLSERITLPDNFIELAVRRRRIVPIGTICTFAGWGKTSPTAIVSTVQLNRLNIPILPHETCNLPNLYAGGVHESMICGGVVTASAQSVCHGNEGSGLYCNNELTGILSFGVECGIINRPGVYTQVRFYNDWLDQQIARNDTPDASLW